MNAGTKASPRNPSAGVVISSWTPSALVSSTTTKKVAYQESQGGAPVDASFSGVCFGPDDVPPEGDGPEALTEWVATSFEAHDCCGRQWNTFIGFTNFEACTAAINHQPTDSIIELLQRSFDNDDLHPRSPGRRPVLDPYEFQAPSAGDDPVVRSLQATLRRVLTYNQSVSSEGDERVIEQYLSALQALETRLGR